MKTAAKYLILQVLAIWAILSLCIICGNSSDTFTITETLLRLALGGLSLGLCIKTAKVCNKEGMLPKINEEEDEL